MSEPNIMTLELATEILADPKKSHTFEFFVADGFRQGYAAARASLERTVTPEAHAPQKGCQGCGAS